MGFVVVSAGLRGWLMADLRRVDPVSGPRSYWISRLSLLLLALFLLFCLSLAITVAVRPRHPDALAFGIFFAMLGGLFGVAILMVSAVACYQYQARRERESGYTWQQSQYQNVDQIDPVSFVVIRGAGEDFLSDSERKRRQEQARAWAAQNPSGT